MSKDLLPEKPSRATRDPSKLKYIFITPPKWGKTSTLCSVPDSLLLACETGHLFHEAHKMEIDCWDYLKQSEEDARAWEEDDDGVIHTSMVLAAEEIANAERFPFIGVDTADMAAKMCLDYHYKVKKVEHASEAGDWGKGWDLTLNRPFRNTMTLLMKSGRGIGFTSHLKLVEKKVGMTTISRYETTLPSGVQQFLHTQADVIWHGTFGKLRKGMDRDRIVVLDGSNEVLAGSRVRGVYLPKRFILDPDKPWEQWTGFFEDEDNAKEAEEEYLDYYGSKKRPELQEEETETEEEIEEKERSTKKISDKKDKHPMNAKQSSKGKAPQRSRK